MNIYVLRSRNIRHLAKRAISFSALLIAASALSGCVLVGSQTVGGRDFDYNISTAATNTATKANLTQPMPNQLSKADNSFPNSSTSLISERDIQVASGPAKYLPPANIGNSANIQNDIVTVPTVNNSNIVANNLPPLPKTSTIGSSNNMSAQPMAKPTPQPTTVSKISPSTNETVNVKEENLYFHTIESGESLFSIARKYGVTVAAIVSANNLASADRIGVGQKIAIPGRSDLVIKRSASSVAEEPKQEQQNIRTQNVARASKSENSASQPSAPKPAPKVENSGNNSAPTKIAAINNNSVNKTSANNEQNGFIWPAEGEVILDFAGTKGTGINIELAEGTPIKATSGGKVIYVGNAVEGFGNLILIKHDNGYVSAYAHLSQTNVTKGTIVRSGEIIGLAGKTGSVTSSQLHFELRKGATPVDPLSLLAG